ncbi:alpha-methylacyl-CoA racemase [Tribolium castaneum]|uniref:Alpha-methylacyl-CoA racemase-like Protein n=1 Tax=Tribolium castaneum TaxID=7070 RepID=D6WLY2_TRICA|nr:PREDICTED: alpha-methylacyl-CoA racemase [Tribolium castaneum]EFA04186.1 Alpha-methylacyl-CoA racemase-like Protein [Tribolium castaneum]|eukprot:XP_974629.1 PREDICTED: alpha-methylacyl-CoA racemase [Tribolium castaneum]
MALRGIRVLELAGLAPAPFCGMVLSDFGASVLRIDKVGANIDLDCLGNGKKSIALNLKDPNGAKIVRKLAKTSDVLIEPFRKGVMERLGLGPETLMKENPRLIYARLTGWGQTGLYSARAGHDINYLALSGLLSLFGRKGQKPIFPVNLAADFGGGGLMCALGILLALHERHSSGLGQVIDSSMVEGTAYLGSWLFRSQKLPIWGNERGSNQLDSGSHFYEVYETKDGKFVSVGALEPQFYEKLLQGLGLSYDEAPQFDDYEKLKVLFARKFKEKTQEEWCRIFDKADACVAPVLTLEEAPEHPHNKERGCFARMGDDIIPKPAPVLSRTPGEASGLKAAPNCGEHTWDVLKGLGYSDNNINDLVAKGTVECFNKSKY